MRDERFRTMLDHVELVAERPARILDLACGTGSIAERARRRFPDAEVVGADLDPVLLWLARQAFLDDDRMHFRDRDLRQPGWGDELDGPFDAVMSATALHWLEQPVLASAYQEIGRILRPGGIFLNADHVSIADARLAAIAARRHEQHRRDAFDAGVESYAGWWARAEREPAFAELLVERERRFSGWDGELLLPAGWHVTVMLAAGFDAADVVWRWGNDAILAGIR